MRGIAWYSRVLESLGPGGSTALLAASAVLVVASLAILGYVRFAARGRLAWAGRILGILGVLVALAGLLSLHELEVSERLDANIRVTHWRYAEAARMGLFALLVGLPIASGYVMAKAYQVSKKKLRATIPALLKKSRTLLAKGDAAGAKAALDEVLSIAPYLGEAYYLRATIHEAGGRPDEALADLDRGLEYDAQMAPAYLLRGRLRTECGELDAAAEDFDRLMQMRANDVEGFLYRGICMAKSGRTEDAVADFQRVLKLTNHSDYADPARRWLKELHAEEPLTLTMDPATVRAMLDLHPRYKDAGGPPEAEA